MNSLGLNEGLMFRQPYESGYAALRRYLSVNPGISLSNIADLFVVSCDPYWSTLKQYLYAKSYRIWPNDKKVDWSFRRQCPVCAQHLYHSQIYALPWITHCPIHHCEFTADCPRCQRPWPSPVEMVQRDCPGCGAFSIQSLKDCKAPLDYRPIADIHAFLRSPEVNYSLGIGRGYLMAQSELGSLMKIAPWWHEVAVSHPMFPACQAHRNPILSPSRMTSLHIKCPPVNYRISKLSPVHDGVVSQHGGMGDQKCLDIAKTSRRRLRVDYEFMKYSISWIAQHTNGHQIHVANYRNMGASDFIDGPEPCPYCMALSIWFFLAAGKKYGHYYSSNINHYPFWDDFEYVPLYNSGEPHLVVGQVEKYFMGDDLSLWFYRRGLEVMFMLIMGSMFRWYGRVQKYHEGKRPKDYLYTYEEPRVLNAQLCSTALSGKHFTYYYDGERPLSQYTPPSRIERVSDICRRYHVHHAHEPMVICDFDYKIPQAGFTYDVFLGLHQQFREFLTKEFWR